MLESATKGTGHEMAFLKDHWKILLALLAFASVFILGLCLGYGAQSLGAATGTVSLVAGWLHKSPSLKAVDGAIAGASAVADSATRQVQADQRATSTGAGRMDAVVGNPGATVAPNPDDLLAVSKGLGKETS